MIAVLSRNLCECRAFAHVTLLRFGIPLLYLSAGCRLHLMDADSSFCRGVTHPETLDLASTVYINVSSTSLDFFPPPCNVNPESLYKLKLFYSTVIPPTSYNLYLAVHFSKIFKVGWILGFAIHLSAHS